MRDLQAFLIKRFIYILVLVTVAQSLISFLISQAVMPVVMKVFFPDYQRQSSVGKTDLFIFMLRGRIDGSRPLLHLSQILALLR